MVASPQSDPTKVFYESTYDGQVFSAQEYDKFKKDVAMKQIGSGFIQEVLSKRFVILLLNMVFILGFVASLLITFFYPNIFNAMTVLVYFYLAFVQNIMLARIKWGVVSDEEGKPFLSTIVTLLTEENKMVARTVTDEEGRFLLIADKGNYVLEVAAVGQQPRQLFSVELKQLGSVNEDIMV